MHADGGTLGMAKDMTEEQGINRAANQQTGEFLAMCQATVGECDSQIDHHEQARAHLAGAIAALEVRRRAAATAVDHILSAQSEDAQPMASHQIPAQTIVGMNRGY